MSVMVHVVNTMTESDWLNHTTSGFLQQHFSIFAIPFFAILQHFPSTLRLNRTPLIQKMPRHEHRAPRRGVPNDLLWYKKCHVTNKGPQDAGSQPTSFDPKNVMSPTQGPNQTFRCLDRVVEVSDLQQSCQIDLKTKAYHLKKCSGWNLVGVQNLWRGGW